MKAIVAGSKNFEPTAEHYKWLQKACKKLGVTEIVSGGCSGADAFGEFFAGKNNLKITIFKADWDTYGKSAGPLRNLEMAKYADVCILFPGGAGTLSMLDYAKQYNLHIEQWGIL